MILVLDNYDSFTYNLTALLQCAGSEVMVFRNDEISVEQIEALQPEGLLISPGPGEPQDSGICPQAVRFFWERMPILGVCLGHQLIAQLCGAKVIRADVPMHGKTSLIHHQGTGIFDGLDEPLKVMRYHSLVVDPVHLPADVAVTAETEQGEIMAIKIISKPSVAGVQFHPESVLTAQGLLLISNWLKETDSFGKINEK